MPPGELESPLPDPGEADDLGPAEAAEAAAAAAEARAELARARASELRRKLEAREVTVPADVETSPTEPPRGETGTAIAVPNPVPTAEKRRPRLPRSATVAGTLAVLLTVALLAATGFMLWQHRKAELERHRAAEYTAAARQSAVNLMSIDPGKAKETVQRIIDGSTGKFKSSFQETADDLIKAMQDAKVTTKVTVNDAAVESMDDQSAVVLVAATSQREDSQAPSEEQAPRVWRVVLTVQRDGGQIKVSDVEFV